MVTSKIEKKITDYLLGALTKRDQEIGRLIVEEFIDQSDIQYWAIRHNTKIIETQLDLPEFPEIRVFLTIVPPKFFTDVFDEEINEDIPFWQIANAKRILSVGRTVYDPEKFLDYYINRAKNLTWSDSSINLKIQVSHELMKKSQRFIDEDPPMLADAYIWGIKAIEESICVQLMKKNLFSITTPSLMLDTLNHEPDLKQFYLDLLGTDELNPDLTFIELKELIKLADHIYHKIGKRDKDREMWILSAFVSINEAERKLNRVFALAGTEGLDLLQFQSLFEDVIAELWQAYFLAAQTPWNKSVPLDPWVVGLFWKWHINDRPKYEIIEILDRGKIILEKGTPYFDWELEQS